MSLPPNIETLIEEFARLPGVGPKTAQRFVFFLLKKEEHERSQMAHALFDLTKGLKLCSKCYYFADDLLCEICKNQKRDIHTLCVVEDALDVISIEKSGAFRGKYHLLGGLISPLDGIGPEKLKIAELKKRIDSSHGEITEVILATNPTIEGEATATYIWKMFESMNIKISRIARGLPVGGDLEYTDEVTLARAIESRIDF